MFSTPICFGIQHFGEDALAKSAGGWSRSFHGHFRVARADHADAEPDEIGGAGVFDGVKRDRRGRKNRGEAKSGGKDVEESANESAERRKDTFALSAGKAARQNVENAWAGRDGQEQGSGEEKQQAMRVEHEEIVRGARSACKISQERRSRPGEPAGVEVKPGSLTAFGMTEAGVACKTAAI